jgi:endonuclease YncB( thermonuclease family)/ribosomal protein S18 acetylase RimI-like enzyme
MADRTPRSDVAPPPPPGFTVVEEPRRRTLRLRPRRADDVPPPPSGFSIDEQATAALRPTGDLYDGDTFGLSSGGNARLYGVDAFELNQQGRTAQGALVPLGREARGALAPFATPSATVSPLGALTYGRPVVTLDNGGDAGTDLLHQGLAVATPEYLRRDLTRLTDYMEEERNARLNRRGAWATQHQNPAAHRRGEPDPWARAEASTDGKGVAVFWDEPTPFQGLRPEIEQAYLSIWQDPKSKPDDLLAFARDNGFTIDPEQTRKAYASRDRGAEPEAAVRYADPPKLLTNMKDGATGAALRGFADPVNLLDEVGALADTLAPSAINDRENVWSSDRRFGDVYVNNLDQNRSVLDYDEAKHPYARFGGQLVGGVALPGASVQGVGFSAARGALRAGAGRFAAEQAARSAVTRRLGYAGAVEGGIAGAGQGETVQERALGAAIGAPVGFGLGAGTGVLAPRLAEAVGRPFSRMVGRDAEGSAQDLSDGALDAAKAGALNTATNTSDAMSARGAVSANVPAGSASEALLTGVFVAPKGRLGFSVEDSHGDGHFLYSVFRDDNGDAKGVVRFPATPEAREPVDGERYDVVQSYVDPAYRRQGIGTRLYDQLREAGYDVDDLSGTHDLTPDGAAFVTARRQRLAAMNAEMGRPALEMPNEAGLSVPRPLLRDATDVERMRAAERVSPSDVLPIPNNTVASLDEAERAVAGRYDPVRAPNERDVLERRTVPNANTGTPVAKRGPLDLVTWLRSQGGVNNRDNSLAFSGVDNRPRDLDFARGEQRFGPLVSDRGLAPDEAADAAWRAGYFPEHSEPPTVRDFLDALGDTHRGINRRFLTDDLSEVEAFDAARAQRLDVERAQAEGSPLVRDNSEPVDLDDLDANAPPVSAYEEWGENAPDFAGNLRLEKLDSPQAIKRALVQVDRINGGFDAATRGRIKRAETERLASELNMTAADLLSRRKGQAFNAEQALAARQILAKSGNELVNIARRLQSKMDAGDATDAEQVAFRAAVVRHAAIQEQVAGATAEAGRALQQFRMTADARAYRGEVLRGLIEQAGGPDGIRRAADLIVDNAADPARVNQTAKLLAKPGWKDKAIELWYNSLLSGPRTHAVNVTSNLLTSLAQIPEHMVAAGVGTVRRAFPGQKDSDQVLFSEAGARVAGFMQGAREGLGEFARTMRTGTTRDFMSKVEAQEQHAISGVKGSILRTPTRLLMAEDELFKAMARRMEVVGLAMRKARREGLKGDAARQRAAELAANPTEDMLDRAMDYARYLTFQRPLGPMGSSGIAFMQRAWPLKLFVPFIRTPVNLLKFAAERSPVAPALWKWSRDFKAGGARRDLAIARWMVGSGAMMSVLELARQGHLTGGGPADPSAKRLLQADGWQPYSLRVGDRYYSYQRLDPFSTTLGLAADYVDLQSAMTEKQRSEVGMTLLGATVQNLSSKTWLSGMSGAVEAATAPERNLEALVSKLAGSTVPVGVSQVAQAVDPLQREARGALDRIRSRIPFASTALPPRRDVLGGTMPSTNGGGLDSFSPIYTSTRKNDPLANALLESGVRLGVLSRTVTNPDTKERVELTPEQYERYRTAAAGYMRPGLEELTASPAWATMDREDRQDEVESIIRYARRDARDELFGGGEAAAGAAVPPPPPGFQVAR